MRIDPDDGSKIWHKLLQGTSVGYNQAMALVISTDGYIYLTGSTSNPTFETIPTNANGYTKIFLSKIDSDGDFIWTKIFGGVINDNGFDIAIDSLNNLYIAASTENALYGQINR